MGVIANRFFDRLSIRDIERFRQHFSDCSSKKGGDSVSNLLYDL
jgi:hypothetical protein